MQTRRVPTALRRILVPPAGAFAMVLVIVVALGLTLTFIAQNALRSLGHETAQTQFITQTHLLAHSLSTTLAQAEPMMNRLVSLARTQQSSDSTERVAHAMRDIIAGHEGVAYVTISFPDGHYLGVHPDPHAVDPSEPFYFQESLGQPTLTLRSRFGPRGALVPFDVRGDEHDYDPRLRPFFEVAVRADARVWTAPYQFARTHYTGITRAEVVRLVGGGPVHAVVTVDYDIHSLSGFAGAIRSPGMRSIAYAGRTIIACPGCDESVLPREPPNERPLNDADLRDDTLRAFFASGSSEMPPKDSLTSFTVGSRTMYATVAPLEGSQMPPWRVAAIVSEHRLYAAQRAYQRRALVVMGASLLVAVAIATAVAGAIRRARAETAEANKRANEASARATELGSYRLVQKIGAGGMGEVRRAQHRLLAREAAIKLIRQRKDDSKGVANAALEEEDRVRFRREAQTLARLRSRHTVELFDYGVADDGTLYVVMELLEGIDLDRLIKMFGPLPQGRALHFLMQACRSLAEAHDKGMVHRDIKPANLFACRAADEVDLLKVLDFGLVHRTDEARRRDIVKLLGEDAADDMDKSLTTTGVLGTPNYMAPEQIADGPVDGRADLYALGCVAFFLLTGTPPYLEKGTALLTAHVEGEIPRVSKRAHWPVAPALEELLTEMLAKTRTKRPLDARVVLSRLAAIEAALDPAERWTETQAVQWWREVRPERASKPSPIAAPAVLRVSLHDDPRFESATHTQVAEAPIDDPTMLDADGAPDAPPVLQTPEDSERRSQETKRSPSATTEPKHDDPRAEPTRRGHQ